VRHTLIKLALNTNTGASQRLFELRAIITLRVDLSVDRRHSRQAFQVGVYEINTWILGVCWAVGDV
jgi:hypothetical protein